MWTVDKFMWLYGLEEGARIVAWSTLLTLLSIFYVILYFIVASLFCTPEQLDEELYGTIFEGATTTGGWRWWEIV